MSSLSPFLMFQGGVADQALAFYVGTIPDSSIVRVTRYGPDGPGPEGTVMTGEAVLAGLRVMFSDSFVTHAFGFTPSLSLFLTRDTDGEVDTLAGALSEGGEVLMPAASYGFSSRFAWVNDRYGVSWQLSTPLTANAGT